MSTENNYTKVYKVNRIWTVLAFLLSLLVIPPMILTLIVSIRANDLSLFLRIFLIVFCFGFIVMVLIFLVFFFRGKVVVTQDKIQVTNIFATNFLYFNEIVEVRNSYKSIFVKSTNKEKKNLIIWTYYLKNGYEISNWLVPNYPDLDKNKKI